MKNTPPTPNLKAKALTAKVILLSLLTIAVSQAFLGGLLRGKKAAQQTQAINNLKQTGTFLFLFNNDYGTFPSDETAAILIEEGIATKQGNNANAYFSQLLSADYTDSEQIFWAPGASVCLKKEPDNETKPLAKLLAPGEVGFAYITFEKNVPLSTTDIGGTPAAIDAYKRDTEKFDPEFRDGKVIYLRLDQSVQSRPLDEEGRILISNPGEPAQFLFDKKSPLWAETPPLLHQPLPAKLEDSFAAPPAK